MSAPQSRLPKIPRKPNRPDFDARDEKLQKLRDKINEYDKVAKTKATEIDALVNEAKANNKLESLKRTLANTMHSRAQLEVCDMRFFIAQLDALIFGKNSAAGRIVLHRSARRSRCPFPTLDSLRSCHLPESCHVAIFHIKWIA